MTKDMKEAALRELSAADFYETRSGHKLRLKAVNAALVQLSQAAVRKELKEEGVIVEPPMFEVKNVAGDSQWFPHTPETLEEPDNPRQTAINKAMWAAYQRGIRELEGAINERTANVLMRMGIECELPEDESWIAKQEKLGVDVPDDPEDRRVHWLSTEVLSQIELKQMIAILSLKAQQEIMDGGDQAALFRDVRRSIEDAVRAETRKALTKFQGDLVSQRDTPGDDDSEGLAPDAE